MTNIVTTHDDSPMSGGIARLPKLGLSEIAAAIRAAKDRIMMQPSNNDLTDQLRGVRRTAAHIADLLPDNDKSAFLTTCGYGA